MRTILFLALTSASWAAATHPNFDDEVKPILRRHCIGCHSAAEARSGLVVETYTGIMKGGNSGDAVKPGRAGASLLYLAVAHEGNGVPRMPLGGAKIPDASIAIIRDWIQLGAPENAMSVVKAPAGPSAEFTGSPLNRPKGEPAMPGKLSALPALTSVHPHPVTALAASPWAPLVAVARHERIALFNSTTRELLGEIAFPEGIPYVLRFSRDGGKLLAAGGRGVQSGKAVVFDVRTGARLATVGEEMDIVLAADITADGKLIALGGPGKVVKVYRAADAKLAYKIEKHTDWITSLAFSPDGTKLASGDRAGGVFLWESAQGNILVALAEHKDSITSLSWRGDGALLVSASEDGKLVVWNANDGFPLATVANAHLSKLPAGTYGKAPNGILSAEFTSDGRIVSVGRDRTIKVWSGDGKARAASTIFATLPIKVAASFDGKQAIAGDYAGALLFWNGQQVQTVAAGVETTPQKSVRMPN